MTSVRIVCAYDGQEAAHALGRVLAAEDYEVEVNHGRVAQAQLVADRDPNEAVVLVWSPRATGSSYILHWRQSVTPTHLVEIAICEAYPAYQRRHPVIDFSNWKGRRGSAAWRALTERLRVISRASAPAKPAPWQAAAALGAASLMAVGGAVLLRMNDTTHQITVAADDAIVSVESFDGLGGPLSTAIEPAGADDPDVVLGPNAPRLSPIATSQATLLRSADLAPSIRSRTDNLFGRIVEMTEPLLDRVSDNGDEQQGP